MTSTAFNILQLRVFPSFNSRRFILAVEVHELQRLLGSLSTPVKRVSLRLSPGRLVGMKSYASGLVMEMQI